MIEEGKKGIHGIGNAFVVINPTDGGIDFALDGDGDFKTVAVHASAFMLRRQGGQRVGGFEVKFFGESCSHGVDGGKIADRDNFSTVICIYVIGGFF